MSQWLDTETKAILQGAPPEKLAPPDTVGFTLVLLSKTADQEWLRRALGRAGCCDSARVESIVAHPSPHVVAAGLTWRDAMFGQFELACCDSAAVFIRDEVVAENDRSYLSTLYEELSASPEFQPVRIQINSVPGDEQGRRFLQQFLGMDETFLNHAELPLHRTAILKKARIMLHWSRKIGADLHVVNL